MTSPASKKILILGCDNDNSDRIRMLFEDRGWQVTCKTNVADLLECLNQSHADPYHVFLANIDLSDNDQYDILSQVKTAASMTRRMLIVPSDRSDIVIRAINRKEVHACIVTPFTDRELVDRVWSCIEIFDQKMKRHQLRRVITHQNKQMFVIAQRLKKKAHKGIKRINSLKKKKAKLTAVLAAACKQKKDPTTIDDRVRDHGIKIDPETLQHEFIKLAEFTRTIFERMAIKTGIEHEFTAIEDAILPELDIPELSAAHEAWLARMAQSVFASHATPALEPPPDENRPKILEDILDVQVSADGLEAVICLKETPDDPGIFNLPDILELLRQQNICYGIVEDPVIESWMSTAHPDHKKLTIARGDPPRLPVDGTITYKFQTDYTNPGKILEDGSIDFRDRGEIPYTHPETVLAVKTMPVPGKQGMTVTGEDISVGEALDPVMLAGSGTCASDDGLTVYSDAEGQPHLAPTGEISVNSELPVQGDVDYKTGNINFNGNIIVKGTVKDGFSVKGVSLTANEIEGGIIDLTGDLNVTNGITNAHIVSVGNIYAKFINNSTVGAFGKVVVQKEIIDSEILLTGSCENAMGVIINSTISAKAGVEAGRIGTDSSKPSQLRVGVDTHLNQRIQKIDASLEASMLELEEKRKKIEQIEHEDNALYGRITEKAQEQELIQKQIQALEARLADLKKSQDQVEVDAALKNLGNCNLSLKRLDEELDSIFNIQDIQAKKIENIKACIDEIEDNNKAFVLKKRALKEFAKKVDASPCVTVAKSITQKTMIIGPNTSIHLTQDRKRCRIEEQRIEEDGLHHYKMVISDLGP